jgi:hypothetical protein
MLHCHRREWERNTHLVPGFAPAGKRRRYPRASSMPSAACLSMLWVSPVRVALSRVSFMLRWPCEVLDVLGGVLRASTIVRHLCASFDTTLIPLRAQYGATQGKAEKGKQPIYGGFASLCKPQQHLTDHS